MTTPLAAANAPFPPPVTVRRSPTSRSSVG